MYDRIYPPTAFSTFRNPSPQELANYSSPKWLCSFLPYAQVPTMDSSFQQIRAIAFSHYRDHPFLRELRNIWLTYVVL